MESGVPHALQNWRVARAERVRVWRVEDRLVAIVREEEGI
jgi:hypothetical protein